MSAQGVSARLARLLLLLRSEQRSLFGPGVSIPDGWDAILTLYIADADGRRLTVGEVTDAMGGCTDAGKRRIAHLSHLGIVIGDGHGDARDVVTLAPEAISRMEDQIERLWTTISKV